MAMTSRSRCTSSAARRKVAGFTLIELLVVLIVSILVLIGIATQLQRYAEGLAAQAAAQHAATVRKAAKAYIADNYATLVASAGPSTPATIAPATLASGGYLPAGFSATNGYGQSFTVKVIEPTANRLEAIVLTTGGDTLDGQNLRNIANLIGVDGGYVVTGGASAVANGAYGGWSRDLTPFGGAAGNGKIAVALFVTEASTQDDYLHRSATAGRPEFNRMNTAVDMNSNDVNNARNVAAANVAASGEVLANEIALGSNRYGGATYPYETISLPAGRNLRFNIGGAERAVLAGDGTFTALGNLVTTGNIIGNVVTTNEAYVNGWFRSQGNGGWYSSAYGGGWHMTDPTWIRAYNGKNVYTSGQMRAGSMRSDGRTEVGEFLDLQGVAVVDAGCAPNGLVGREADGSALNCVNGIWKRAGGLSESVTVFSTYVSRGSMWAYAYCPSGYTVTGGGYALAWRRDNDANVSPWTSRAETSLNAWAVWSGDWGNMIYSVAQCSR